MNQNSKLSDRDERVAQKLLEDYKRINPSKLLEERQDIYEAQLRSLYTNHFDQFMASSQNAIK